MGKNYSGILHSIKYFITLFSSTIIYYLFIIIKTYILIFPEGKKKASISSSYMRFFLFKKKGD